MTRIFISYRRQDTRQIAGRIFDRLEAHFGRDHVFMDIDSIPFGVDFHDYLDEQVACAETVLALIGPGWAEARDEAGNRRLDNPDDFVRIEIEAALRRGISLGAVLIDGAPMPRPEELPEDMRTLCRRNAAPVDSGRDFHGHTNRLIADLERHLSGAVVQPVANAGSQDRGRGSKPPGWMWAAGAGAIALVIAVSVFFQGDPPPKPEPGNGTTATTEAAGTGAAGAVEVELANGETKRIVPGSGESFKECDVCPEMVVAPAGTFVMGSGDGETPVNMLDGSRGLVLPAEDGRFSDEGPPHEVRIPEPFAIGKFEVTFAEWDACVAEGGCRYSPEEGPGRGKQPVIRVSWDDIVQQYIPWLNRKVSGNPDKPYRLPTEAEWEYAARAGTTTRYWFGDDIPDGAAQYGYFSFWTKTVPVDSFQPNSWGLYNVHGNVWEWVQDCYADSYNGAPDDGSAWTAGDCGRRILRGGSWRDPSGGLRAAFCDFWSSDRQVSGSGGIFGFRVARTLFTP